MSSVLIVGRATCVWKDIQQASALVQFDEVAVVGRVGYDYPLAAGHWVSFHVEQFDNWIAKRRKNGYPDIPKLWSSKYRGMASVCDQRLGIQRVPNEGGSSGMIAVSAMKLVGHRKIVLAGIPMTADAGQYDSSKPWNEANAHRKPWEDEFLYLKDLVRSMSGWTRELFGAPTKDWLNQ